MSKQLELALPRKRTTVIYNDPPGSDGVPSVIDPIEDFETRLNSAMHAIDACGPTMAESGDWLASAVRGVEANAGLLLVDGEWIQVTPWFNGWEHEAPPRNGWYEVDVAGQLFPFNGYWCDTTQDFRQGDIDGQIEHYALNNCRWRGLTRPAPGGYGAERGRRPVRASLVPRRRVVLVD